MAADDELDDEYAEHQPTLPTHDISDEEVAVLSVDYSDRNAGDWVASGPLGSEGIGCGRRFNSWSAAEQWARGFYGVRLKRRVPECALEGANRWGFLIRGV